MNFHMGIARLDQGGDATALDHYDKVPFGEEGVSGGGVVGLRRWGWMAGITRLFRAVE